MAPLPPAPPCASQDLVEQQATFLISINMPKACPDYVYFDRAEVEIERFLDHD
jgi:hypothetical protein